MAFQSWPDIAEVAIRFSQLGKPLANVLHAQKSSGYTQGDLDTLAVAVDDWVDIYYKPLFSNTVDYVETVIKGLTSIVDLSSSNDDSAGVGAITGTGAPANASLVVTLRTGFTGRSARGRVYCVPAGVGNFTDAHNYSTTYTGAINSAFDQFKIDMATAGWQWVVASRRTNGANRPAGIITPVYDAVFADDRVDSMRRRLNGRGD